MRSRIIIGTITTLLFAKQFLTINKLQFPYPYISQPSNKHYSNQKSSYRKNSYLLSIKSPQLFANKFDDLADNDLVLCETPKGELVYKIVGAVSRNYTPFENGVSNFIPPGFVFLVDPKKKQVGMENIAVVRSKTHFSLGKFESWWNNVNSNNTTQKDQQPSQQLNPQEQESLERQILARNNIRDQIKQAEMFRRRQKQDTSDQQ